MQVKVSEPVRYRCEYITVSIVTCPSFHTAHSIIIISNGRVELALESPRYTFSFCSLWCILIECEWFSTLTRNFSSWICLHTWVIHPSVIWQEMHSVFSNTYLDVWCLQIVHWPRTHHYKPNCQSYKAVYIKTSNRYPSKRSSNCLTSKRSSHSPSNCSNTYT